MPSPQDLAAAGPWAVVVAIGIGLGIAFVRRWIAPGWVYDREVARGDAAVAEVKALTDVLRDGLAANAKAVGEGLAAAEKSLDALTDEIRWDIRERHSVPRDRDAAT